jgi:hypothetical protein
MGDETALRPVTVSPSALGTVKSLITQSRTKESTSYGRIDENQMVYSCEGFLVTKLMRIRW